MNGNVHADRVGTAVVIWINFENHVRDARYGTQNEIVAERLWNIWAYWAASRASYKTVALIQNMTYGVHLIQRAKLPVSSSHKSTIMPFEGKTLPQKGRFYLSIAAQSWQDGWDWLSSPCCSYPSCTGKPLADKMKGWSQVRRRVGSRRLAAGGWMYVNIHRN